MEEKPSGVSAWQMSAGGATGCDECAPLYIWKQTDEKRRTGLVVEQALWAEYVMRRYGVGRHGRYYK